MNSQIIEEIMNHFGRTGSKQRPRIRKFHAELLATKYRLGEKVLSKDEIKRPDDYIKRMVKFSKGFLEFINEEALEIKLTDSFFDSMDVWKRQYIELEELDHSDANLGDQGIIVTDDNITFDGKLTYSRFYKVVSDEGESMNNPESWLFNDKNIEMLRHIDFSDKDSPAFSSRLFLLKFYVLRKIDEVAFVTSRYVHCPKCGSNYVIPASKIEFQQSYKCEHVIGDRPCGTTLRKFPARKMLPTYIYEISVEVKNKERSEFKEFFLESFVDLHPGFYTGMLFGRTENKTNSFYFTGLTAREEKAQLPFSMLSPKKDEHKFFTLHRSIFEHIKRVGFVLDDDKAQLVYLIETLKKLTLTVNREINLAHSLYFGAPGIGKTHALTLLNHAFYSNSGFISGPRFSLPGLTGGQKEIFYQDTAKKKNVPGLFSNQAFTFDEINNAQFLGDNKAVNLFKSVVLAPSGTSSTVGGKEFPRIAIISGTANYDIGYLRHYENKVKKIYNSETKTDAGLVEQKTFLSQLESSEKEIPPNFDFYAPLRDYGSEIPSALRTAVLKVRDGAVNYLTNFEKPLMERFYWTVLVHPKYDKEFRKQKEIAVEEYFKARNSKYSQRELISQLFIPEFDATINDLIKNAKEKIDSDPKIERGWTKQVKEFLALMSGKYVHFFSMFNRISQVHIFTLYALSLINNETNLSYTTRRIYERLIALLHTPIEIEEFHNPDFENFRYLGEKKGELLVIIKRYPDRDLRDFVDFERKNKDGISIIKKNLAILTNDHKIRRLDEYVYEIDTDSKFEEVEKEYKEE